MEKIFPTHSATPTTAVRVTITQDHGCQACGPHINFRDPLRPLVKFSREGGLGRLHTFNVCGACLRRGLELLEEGK